jgi:hypothetical protein
MSKINSLKEVNIIEKRLDHLSATNKLTQIENS